MPENYLNSRAYSGEQQGVPTLLGSGDVPTRLITHGLSPASLRHNAVLQKDEWLLFDTAVVEEAKIRLVAVADLMNANQTFNLPNAMGTTVLQWEDMEDMTAATRSMDGITRGNLDRLEFNSNQMPIHITHKDFRLNLRHLEASRKNGTPLDATHARVASRIVSESLEDALFNGTGLTWDNGTVYGYTNHPNRNTGTISDWGASGTSGNTILTNLLSMVSALEGDRMYGPYQVYVPGGSSGVWTNLQEDFKANSDRSTIERLRAVAGILDIKPCDQLADGNVVMVQMTPDVVELVDGEEITNVQWDTDGGFQINFKVMAIQVHRLKKDAAGRMGLAHFTW